MHEDLFAICNERMNTSDVVYMTTLRGGYPCTRAMLNMRNRDRFPDHQSLYEPHQEDLMTYVVTNTGSRKRKEIEADTRVCLYYCHPSDYFGVSLVGDLEVIEDMDTKLAVWAENLAPYFPTGKPTDPDYTLLRLCPRTVSGWNQGQKFSFEMPS